MSRWIRIIATSEVSVIGRNDGVLFALFHVLAIPLTNARATCVGKDSTTKVSQNLCLRIQIKWVTHFTLFKLGNRMQYGRQVITIQKNQVSLPSESNSTKSNFRGFSITKKTSLQHLLVIHYDAQNYEKLTMPSRSIVARTCSDPGVTLNGIFDFRPRFNACFTMLAHRPMSS